MFEIDLQLLLLGLAIFSARVIDVSLGTIRTVAIVRGRTITAFIMGFFEVLAWLVVITTVVQRVSESPILALFYALGYSTGNVVGIWLERQLAIGSVIVRVISRNMGPVHAAMLRESGRRVTVFEGSGSTGPVQEVFTVCERKELKEILRAISLVEPDVFYVTEYPGEFRRLRRQVPMPTGWRAVRKRK